MLLVIYKEMTDKLSLIDVAANELCFASGERSAFSVAFAKMIFVLNFVLFKLE